MVGPALPLAPKDSRLVMRRRIKPQQVHHLVPFPPTNQTRQEGRTVRTDQQIMQTRYRRTHPANRNVPLWVRNPRILQSLVSKTRVHGRLDLACDTCRVNYETVKKWMQQGNREAVIADELAGEYTPLAEFYYQVRHARSIFLSGRIRRIIELADSTDPKDKGLYKHYHIWLMENSDMDTQPTAWINDLRRVPTKHR